MGTICLKAHHGLLRHFRCDLVAFLTRYLSILTRYLHLDRNASQCMYCVPRPAQSFVEPDIHIT